MHGSWKSGHHYLLHTHFGFSVLKLWRIWIASSMPFLNMSGKEKNGETQEGSDSNPLLRQEGSVADPRGWESVGPPTNTWGGRLAEIPSLTGGRSAGADLIAEGSAWPELQLSELLLSDTVRALHETINNEWDSLQRTACQTAAGRALWKHVIHDPLAEVLAGETYLRSLYEKIIGDRLNNAREVSGVILAVRTLWFDSKLEASLNSFNGGEAQVVLLGAGMDARAYRLNCLKGSNVFEVDFPELLHTKATLLQAAIGSTNEQLRMIAKSVTRVAADIRDNNWLEKLQQSGFIPERNTVWLLEGILYYLPHSHAMQVLKIIASNCTLTHTVLLADFMNKSSTTISESTYHFYSDWPDHLLPSLGFSNVKLSQIGDPDANFSLMHDPLNIFNKIRSLPRSVQTHPDDGTPCHRLYLVQATGSPNNSI